jgi:hypothetical protein
VCTLPLAARVGVMDELGIEVDVENAIDGMVQEPVADRSLVDIARLWIGNVEGMVTTVTVSFGLEIVMEIENIFC